MSIAVPLQELKILEMLPFDRRVVQLYGSCTKGDNIQLVLEFMQVTTHNANTLYLLVYLCVVTN